MLFAIGSYVYLKSHPYTHKGTIAGGSMLEGNMRYIFHLDERITSVSCPDRYVYEWDLERGERPDEEEIRRINRLVVNA